MILSFECDMCGEQFKTEDMTVVVTGTRTVCKPCYDSRFEP